MKFKDIILEWLLIENKEEIYKKYYSDIDRNTFIRIIKADPQTSVGGEGEIINIGPYSKILLNIFRKGNLKTEDLPKANEYLTLVYRYRIPVDINKVLSITDLYDLVKNYIAKSEKSITSILATLNEEEYDIILNSDSWYILAPKTEKASAYLGVNTEWCTAWGQYSLNPDYKDRTNHFKSHNSKGPLYIMINKENEFDKYQLHFESNQLKNPADREISDRPKFFDDRLEIKQTLFPFIYKTDLNIEEIKRGLTTSKNFLSEDDYKNLFNQFMSIVGVENDLVSLLSNYSDEYKDSLENFITDPIIRDVSVTRHGLEIEVSELPGSAKRYERGINYLKGSLDDAYNYVSESEYYSFDDGDWVEGMLDGYLEEYYKENVSTLKSTFGYIANSYELFHKTFMGTMIDDEKIRDSYVDKFTEGTGASLENAYRDEINRNEEFLDIDLGWSIKTITFKTEKLITYIAEKDIKLITNLDSFIEDYMYWNDLVTEDNFEMPEYDYVSPSQEAMNQIFDEFFERMEDEFENSPECGEERKTLTKIVEKYFKNSNYFENDFVIIKLLDGGRLDCEEGVMIYYMNKKSGENYRGNVKVENLINYMQIEPLFESLKFKNIINEIKKG